MKLERIDSLTPASYNPRAVDPERLALVKLSIQKLGWLIPVYATNSGEILSGHQRTHVAREIGYRDVPVVRVPDMPDHTRKAVNILFNRSTNDLDVDAVPVKLAEQIRAMDIYRMAEHIPDSVHNLFPCLDSKELQIEPFVKLNSGRWIPYAHTVTKSLYQHGIIMPIILDHQGIVINGIGRLQLCAEKSFKTARFVLIPERLAEFARAMLNLLSMDFDIASKYGDLLRHNSFRRIRRQRKELGRGFTFAVIGHQKASRTFDIRNARDRAAWIAAYGKTVLDFGAGHLTETTMLRESGIDCTPFEPYRIDASEQIDKQESIRTAVEFLEAVRSGKQWSSIFISSVLNSVPFDQDRRHIVKICSALCGPKTVVYAVASSNKQKGFAAFGRKYLNQREQTTRTLLHYEENVSLAEIGDLPKVQKYHTPQMFYDLFKTAFRTVQVKYDKGNNVAAIARDPGGREGLRGALEFEFDLPYPDGSRMGLAKEAIEAFETRLKVKL